METLPRLFDFSRWEGKQPSLRESVIAFAQRHPFRSAVVQELVLDNDFYRRPLRPEDLDFIKFGKPVRRNTYRRLPFFAAQRELFSVNDLETAVWSSNMATQGFTAFDEFYSAENAELGSLMRPFLEDFSFGFLSDRAYSDNPVDILNELRDEIQIEGRCWGGLAAMMRERGYEKEGLKFALIQMRSLLPGRRVSLARAAASGYFDWLEPSDRPEFSPDMPSDAALDCVAANCGADRTAHSYWQYYLSTSLAQSNLLNALARRPDRALDLVGAAYIAMASWLGFACFFGQLAGAYGLEDIKGLCDLSDAAFVEIEIRMERVLAQAKARFGQAGLARIARGMSAARALSDCVRDNLTDQLAWLSSAEEHQRLARLISERIERECPGIDRETFVEPREMCSTTHVHSDHRLVVVESGDMVFWGNLGMEVRLKPGEMIFIPEGRLHGSSIESDECTYHQPIIPDEWIATLSNWAAPAVAE
ncbi:cupin domain-containing protein [Acetobacter senegalensis]|uniref:cupin domain-containing protein n=1 Tax=Acetobacter senegalensis TaxID=446692 RepID=UPI0026528C87|nr:cupin domain-containing protein [Acetobacter senegalensis]MDN7353675.1 cupin domain-containing protein [Acetobacter senegalensis]